MAGRYDNMEVELRRGLVWLARDGNVAVAWRASQPEN